MEIIDLPPWPQIESTTKMGAQRSTAGCLAEIFAAREFLGNFYEEIPGQRPIKQKSPRAYERGGGSTLNFIRRSLRDKS